MIRVAPFFDSRCRQQVQIERGGIFVDLIYIVSPKHVPPSPCYNFNEHESISIILADMLSRK